MSRKETLVRWVASEAKVSKANATTAVTAVLDGIQQLLVEDGSVGLVGFGKFSVVTRGASKGRNPRTGEVIDIPEAKRVKLSVGKGLRAAIR